MKIITLDPFKEPIFPGSVEPIVPKVLILLLEVAFLTFGFSSDFDVDPGSIFEYYIIILYGFNITNL